MILSQHNSCAICRKKFESIRKTFIDHDHKTGKVRALLCASCNSMIGHANDNTDILYSAIKYIGMFKT